MGEICPEGHKIFPPRDLCPHCQKEAKEPFRFSGKGEVYSYTILREPAEEFAFQGQVTLALIKLEEGPLVTAQLTDIYKGDIKIGMPVELTVRKLRETYPDTGLFVYGYKFRPRVQAIS